MSLFSHLSRTRKRAQAQKVIRKAVVETLESRRLLSITNFSFTGDTSVQEGHQAHFVLTADTDHDWTNPSLAVHIDFGVKDAQGTEETMDFSITPGQTNDIYGTFHEESSSPAHVTCSVHDDGAFTYNIGPDDRMGDLYINVGDADLIGSPIDVPCPETPDANGYTVTPSDVTVGNFTDTASSDSEIGDFVAQIDWGDGTTSQGKIVLSSAPNYYSVIGSHAYQATAPSPDPVIGNWPINVTVTDLAMAGGGGSEGGASVIFTSTAKVARKLFYNVGTKGQVGAPDISTVDPALNPLYISLSKMGAATYADFGFFCENRACQNTKIDPTAAPSPPTAWPNNKSTGVPKVGIFRSDLKPRTGQETELVFEVDWSNMKPQPDDTYTVSVFDKNNVAAGMFKIVFIP